MKRLYCSSCNKFSIKEIKEYIISSMSLNPIPLPTKIHKHTILKSPNGNKKHLQQIEKRVYRCFFILNKISDIQLSHFKDVFITIK